LLWQLRRHQQQRHFRLLYPHVESVPEGVRESPFAPRKGALSRSERRLSAAFGNRLLDTLALEVATMWFLSKRRPGSAPRRPRLHPSFRPQLECLEGRCCPSYTLVTSRAALAGTDAVDWGTVGPAETLVANPFTILSTAGLSIGVNKPIADDFQ